MGKSKFLKEDVTTSQDLSSAALSYTTTVTQPFQLEAILFHFSVAVTEKITITLDSVNGANYDTVLRTINVNSATDAVYIPDSKINFYAGDKIKIACTNANATGTVYATIKMSEVS
jgi:hypothetical protein